MKEIKIVIDGQPITKKNSQRIIYNCGRKMLIPSKQFQKYQEHSGKQIKYKSLLIDSPVNVACVYYMPTRRRVDLVNLIEATCDILTHYGVIKDDCAAIVAAHDGSRVLYDKTHPRAEITITEAEQWHGTN